MRVAFFPTCLVDLFLPEVAEASLRVLRAAGADPAPVRSWVCCGQPLYNSGERERAREVARRNVAALGEVDALVLPSGSCAAMIRRLYPELLPDDPAVRRLAERTWELTQFLVRVLQVEALPQVGGTVTYHDACHMSRGLGERETPRRALALAGVQVREMADADRCCGFGGIFSAKFPEVSGAMLLHKLARVGASGAPVLVTADPGCLLHLRAGLRRRGIPIRARHVAEVLAGR